MSMLRTPPILGTWVLKQLCGGDVESVLGDLEERFQRGKTKSWYSRQVLLAIVESALHDIRHHKVSTVVALLITAPIYWYLGAWAFQLLWMFEKIWPSLFGFPDIVIGSLIMFATGVVPGWILSRFNSSHRRSTLLLFSLILFVSWIYYSWIASIDDIGASPYWEAYFWMNTILQVLGVLTGGLIDWRRRFSRIRRKLTAVLPISVLLIGIGIGLSVSRPAPIHGQEAAAGSLEGIVTVEGTNDPIPDVQISVLVKGSLAATGFSAPQVLQVVSRGANVNPELVQMAQDATRGGPRAAIANAPPTPAITDSAGRFIVRGLAAGEYFVRAQLPGYFGPEFNGVRAPISGMTAVISAAQSVDARLSLIKGSTISGRVLDPAGKPLMNARVVALFGTYENGTPVLQPVSEKSTDDRGAFRVGIVPPGEYYLAAVPVPAGAKDVASAVNATEMEVLTLYPNATEAVEAIPIVVHGGQDLSGMNMQMRTVPALKISGRVTHTLPPGPAPGGPGGSRPLVATLVLAPKNKSGLPELGPVGGVVTASDDGSFEISNVPAGAYELFARLPIARGWGALAPPERATIGWTIGRASIDVRGGNLKDVSLVVNAGTDLKGQVTMDGQPVDAANAAFRISFIPDDSATAVNENQISQVYGQIARYVARIETGGSFTIPLLPPGHYRAEVLLTGGPAAANSFVSNIRQGGANVFDDGILLSRGSTAPVEITLSSIGGSIEGNVVGADRKPVPQTTVVLVPAVSRRQNPALYKTAQTDSQGHFAMTGIAPGSWKLFAWESFRPGAYQNAEFLHQYEERGTSVMVAAGMRVNAEVPWIRK